MIKMKLHSVYNNSGLYGFEMAQLVHLQQIERGLSAMFVGSGKDASLILRLQNAYDETNDAICLNTPCV